MPDLIKHRKEVSENNLNHLFVEELKASGTGVSRLLKRFVEINNLRLQRTYAALSKRQQKFLTLIPSIIHSNNEELPGYVKGCPCGFANFDPPEVMQEAAKHHAIPYSQVHNESKRTDILALYLMGSPGTIAYNIDSDFDFWLCYNPDLPQSDLDKLNQKAEDLRVLAEEFELEITIFLVNHRTFREGDTIPLSGESSGSSQRLLLLEEFYRTSILLAGRYPFWWAVNPNEEETYAQSLEEVKKGTGKLSKFIQPFDYIDFGDIHHIPADEFLGATLWQIYKGISSPYKSLLKLVLMEAYASEYPNIELLSTMFKKHVYFDDQLELNTIDPYLLLNEKLSQYLQTPQFQDRMELIQRCFYLKVDCDLSQEKPHSALVWRVEVMREVLEQWQWQASIHQRLDNKNLWRIDDIVSEQQTLINALTSSYHQLSDFFNRQDVKEETATISKRDLNLLGRKLHSAFDRRNGKLDIVNRQYKSQLMASHITFHEYINKKKMTRWSVYSDIVYPTDKAKRSFVHQADNLMQLICWLFFNRVINQYSKYSFYNHKGHQLELKEVILTFIDLSLKYPGHTIGQSSLEDLSKSAYIDSSCLFINLFNDPFSNQKKKKHVVSTLTDALKYGGSQKNIVLSIDLLYVTSWKEIMFFHYQGETAILDCLCQYLRWNYRIIETGTKTDTEETIFPDITKSYSNVLGDIIAQRVEQVITNVVNSFRQCPAQQYFIAVGQDYYLISQNDGNPSYKKLNTWSLLTKQLMKPRKQYFSLTFDENVNDFSLIESIYKYNAKETIQFFYYQSEEYVDAYIIDDLGSLHYSRQNKEKDNLEIKHYILFLRTIIERREFDPSSELTISKDNAIALTIYEISLRNRENHIIEKSIVDFSIPSYFLNVEVIAYAGVDQKTYFTFYCDGHEFSTLHDGQDAYHQLAKYVYENRQSEVKYPIYLTDMDFNNQDNTSSNMPQTQISQLLKYKNKIEELLNRELKSL